MGDIGREAPPVVFEPIEEPEHKPVEAPEPEKVPA